MLVIPSFSYGFYGVYTGALMSKARSKTTMDDCLSDIPKKCASFPLKSFDV